VIALILSDAAKLAALGVTLGLGVAWTGLRWLGPAAPDTAARDAGVYAAAATFALVTTVASAWIPARSRVSPQEAIRG
jgi:hypothetical protein